MPNILSKFCAGQLGFQICHAECHELSHTWNPNCLLAIWDAMGPSFVFCGKTYGFLYLLKALIDKRGRVDKVDWSKWLAKTIRSSLFLTSTEILFMLWLCAFRRLLGFATWPTISFVNGFAACAISIWIESKQRRAMLIPYLLNLSSEALFRQAQHRGIVRRPLPFVESILFGLSIGLIVALLKGETAVSTSKNKKGNFASSAAFLGSLFHHSHGIILRQQGCGFVTGDSNARDKKWKSFTITFKTAARNFLLSSSLLSIHRLVRRVFTAQRKPAQSIFGWNIFRLPLFLGSMPLLFQIFRSVSSLSFTEQCADAIGAVFSSSLAMAFFWPNNTLALYAFWKMIELVYYQLMVAQLIPAFPGGDVLLFCLLSAYLLSCAVLEPHVLRPSYYKFLCSLTGNRLQLFNRPLFSKFFSTNSSILLRRDFRPDKILSPKLLTINPAFYRPPPVAFIK